MAIQGTIQHNASVPGISIQSAITRTGTGGLPPQQVALEAAQPGTLSTRTSDTVGELTLESGHGIVDAEVIDIFWIDADGLVQCAHGALVGVVAGLAVPFTLASGTVLPVEDYVITAAVVITLEVAFDGDLLEMIVASNTQYGHIVFEDSGDAELDYAVLQTAEPYSWHSNSGITNPLIGNPVDEIIISNGFTTVSTFRFGGVYNSDE